MDNPHFDFRLLSFLRHLFLVIRHFPHHGSLAKSNTLDGRDCGTDVRAVSDPRVAGVVVCERINAENDEVRMSNEDQQLNRKRRTDLQRLF